MSPSLIEFLRHIQKELHFLADRSVGLTFEQFSADDLLSRAFIRSLEIVGEACKKVPDEIRYKYPEVEWRRLAGLRDVLIHQYFQVDYHIVWQVIEYHVPAAKDWLDHIIEAEQSIS
ncbi:HepT-like ribonuclease domain-containing protein [Dyadobacter sp. OTU695]|uniref:HepT-like ribonuclease domain-containing protein n=1 Tax=Dyadobacter sp. OTU695 TaxID=3043860 RepID=UPI00313C6CB3